MSPFVIDLQQVAAVVTGGVRSQIDRVMNRGFSLNDQQVVPVRQSPVIGKHGGRQKNEGERDG